MAAGNHHGLRKCVASFGTIAWLRSCLDVEAFPTASVIFRRSPALAPPDPQSPGFFLFTGSDMAPKSDRNRLMFAAFEAGRSVEQLGEDHALTHTRVRAVLTDEKHRRIISPEPFYRTLRRS
jgi:hypothetical protein